MLERDTQDKGSPALSGGPDFDLSVNPDVELDVVRTHRCIKGRIGEIRPIVLVEARCLLQFSSDVARTNSCESAFC